jgi:hypothetical protein
MFFPVFPANRAPRHKGWIRFDLLGWGWIFAIKGWIWQSPAHSPAPAITSATEWKSAFPLSRFPLSTFGFCQPPAFNLAETFNGNPL